MIRFLVFTILCAAFITTGFAESDDVPDEVSGLCRIVHMSAYSAVANREAGMPREELQSALKPLSIEEESPNFTEIGARAYLLYSLQRIIEEVYDHEPLSGEVYATFRGELCVRDTNGAHISVPYGDFLPGLKVCDEYGEDKTISCVLAVVEAIAENVK